MMSFLTIAKGSIDTLVDWVEQHDIKFAEWTHQEVVVLRSGESVESNVDPMTALLSEIGK